MATFNIAMIPGDGIGPELPKKRVTGWPHNAELPSLFRYLRNADQTAHDKYSLI